MITCVKCGAQNQDEGRYCLECGYKLQSTRKEGIEDGGWAGIEEEIRYTFWSEGPGKALIKDLEAWILALTLLALALVCAGMNVPWPMYLILPLAWLAARWRKL